MPELKLVLTKSQNIKLELFRFFQCLSQTQNLPNFKLDKSKYGRIEEIRLEHEGTYLENLFRVSIRFFNTYFLRSIKKLY